MIKDQIALIRRELWEHRSLFVTPAVLALLASLGTITGQASISAFDQMVDVAIIGGTNLGENERAAMISALMTGVSGLIFIGMWFLTIFYPLDALYAERKDRSILFWRSIPCTDFETVLSKLLTVVLVIPLITFAAILVTHLVVLILWSIWLAVQGGSPGHLIWSAASFGANWLATIIFLFAAVLWASPLIGWFLFVSAFTKRAPFLMAFLPLVVLPMLEKILIGTSALGEAFSIRTLPYGLFRDVDPSTLFDEDNLALTGAISPLDLYDLGGFVASPDLWLGIIVCGLFTTAAIYVRRYRDES
jgi:ABC-2 type transport system permease protein